MYTHLVRAPSVQDIAPERSQRSFWFSASAWAIFQWSELTAAEIELNSGGDFSCKAKNDSCEPTQHVHSRFANYAGIFLLYVLVRPGHAGGVVGDAEVAVGAEDDNAAVSVHALL